MSKPTFGYTAVTAEQSEILALLNREFTTLESRILRHVPVGRRQSLALTNLEQAAMWAAKAVAKDGPDELQELVHRAVEKQVEANKRSPWESADDPCDAGIGETDAHKDHHGS